MNKYKTMTYKEFTEYCNKRACDGQWSLVEAINCVSIMEKINKIKVKGLFKKKQTEQLREEAWRDTLKESYKNENENDR